MHRAAARRADQNRTTVRRTLRRSPAALLVLLLGALGVAHLGGAAAIRAPMPEYHDLVFPVQEQVSYSDTWGACRGTNCSRRHIGQDLIGKRLDHIVAATAGTVTFMRTDAAGSGGNWLEIRSPGGWYTMYGHINNDTPGTDDGANPERWRYAPGLHVGSVVKAGQFVAYLGDSGNAENSVPHLHFELHRPDRTPINAWPSLRLAQGLPIDSVWCAANRNPRATPDDASGSGLWVVTAKGAVDHLGDAADYGDVSTTKLWAPVLGIRHTATGKGYYLIARDGGVFSFGDARFYGSTGGKRLDAPIRGITATPSGHGYWLFADDGGVFSFGDAKFRGSAAGKLGTATAVAMTSTPTGKGYWIAASDGRVFAFGDALTPPKRSATTKLSGKVRSIASTPSGDGYWLVSDQGEVVPAGDADAVGDPANAGLCHPTGSVGIVASATGGGYWVAQADGTVLAFGDAVDLGSTTLTGLVGVDAAP